VEEVVAVKIIERSAGNGWIVVALVIYFGARHLGWWQPKLWVDIFVAVCVVVWRILTLLSPEYYCGECMSKVTKAEAVCKQCGSTFN
jgi:hypothetical protein